MQRYGLARAGRSYGCPDTAQRNTHSPFVREVNVQKGSCICGGSGLQPTCRCLRCRKEPAVSTWTGPGPGVRALPAHGSLSTWATQCRARCRCLGCRMQPAVWTSMARGPGARCVASIPSQHVYWSVRRASAREKKDRLILKSQQDNIALSHEIVVLRERLDKQLMQVEGIRRIRWPRMVASTMNHRQSCSRSK